MNESLKSILIGLSGIYLILILAVILSVKMTPDQIDPQRRTRLIQLFLGGIFLQSIHFMEEVLTGFYIKFPRLLGLYPWSLTFFVAFNLFWIAFWLVSVFGIYQNIKAAFFPLWFFILACLLNLLVHPLLALATLGYFPGLYTAPFIGVIGVMLFKVLHNITLNTKD